jgi:hypothetical protein
MSDEIIKNEELEAVTPVESTVEEVATPVKEEVKKAPKVKKAKEAPAKEAKKAPGMYFEGKLIEAIPARLGRKWTVLIDGKRHKVLRDSIEIVE